MRLERMPYEDMFWEILNDDDFLVAVRLCALVWVQKQNKIIVMLRLFSCTPCYVGHKMHFPFMFALNYCSTVGTMFHAKPKISCIVNYNYRTIFSEQVSGSEIWFQIN